jgi:tetratricopeptide (TPR) repeat protein
LVKQKEYAEAEGVLNQAVSRYPEEAGVERVLSETYRFMGMSQARQGKRRESFESFELSIQWDEKNVWSMLNYGQLLYQLEPQRVLETDDAFAKVLALKENDPNVWRNLIGFWLNQDEEERATMLCQQAAEKEFAEELKDLCE